MLLKDDEELMVVGLIKFYQIVKRGFGSAIPDRELELINSIMKKADRSFTNHAKKKIAEMDKEIEEMMKEHV